MTGNDTYNISHVDKLTNQNAEKIYNINSPTKTPCINLNPLTNPVYRNFVKKLYDTIIAKPYVHLYGIGGLGKTSLVRLCVFHSDYKDSFGSVVYISVENAIERDFVNTIKNNKKFSEIVNENELTGDVAHDYHTLMSNLERQKTIDDKINLLIFDINDTHYDDKGKAVFARKVDANKANLPAHWKVLLVSRIECEYIFPLPLKDDIEDKFLFAKRLFEKYCKNFRYINENMQREIFERLHYNSLLISIIAGNIEPDSDEKIIVQQIKKIFDIVKKCDLGMLAGHKTEQDKVDEYLNALVSFKKLPSYNCKIIVSLFMLWPTQFVPLDVIREFLRFYSIIIGKRRKASLVETDFINLKRSISSPYSETSKRVKKELDTLESLNILQKDDKGSAYQMHAMLAKCFSEQYEKMIKGNGWFSQLFVDFFRWLHKSSVADHEGYIKGSDFLLKNLYDVNLIPKNEQSRVVECIAPSIDWLSKNDPKLKIKMKQQIASILQNNKILLYIRESEIKEEINDLKMQGKNCAVLFNKYLDFAEFYEEKTVFVHGKSIPGYCDASSAFLQFNNAMNVYERNKDFIKIDVVKFFRQCVRLGKYVHISHLDLASVYYKKAIDVYENNISEIREYSEIITAYLKCAEAADMYELSYYGKAFDIYINHKGHCDLDDFDAKLLEFLSGDLRSIDNDGTPAAFFYRLGRFYENYYWETEQDSTIIFNAKKFFKAADDIWSSLPPETEGALKGFVKTSYGVYDPIYGFKLVKVEKGCFDMGIKESDSGYPEYFKKLEELRNALLMTEKLKVDDEGLLQVKNRFHMLEGEGCCHQKTIEEDFYIGMYPVTKSQWEKCACEFVLPSFIEMKKDGIENIRQYNKLPKKPPIEIGGRDSNCPMNYVSAYDADAFVEGLNKTDRLSKYALPTDAQWEYAARGGNNNTRTNYSGSDDIDIVANYGGKITGNEDTMLIGSGPCPVGSLKPNALGLYDMSGNVWEWCRDWYNSQWYKIIEGGFCPEEHAEVINFKQGNYSYSGPARVLRGGSWGEDALNCRVSDRTMNSLSDRVSTFGLRLVLTSPKKEEK